jgi:LysR family glycine cleavage system transcriptional activator
MIIHTMGEFGSHRLPPLTALRTFEAAARHQNFSRAGDELHITHSAISHQMRALERELGVALFHRGGRGVQLTEPGRTLAAAVRGALDRIARGVETVRERRHRALTVSVLPAFATHWLIPRLADFDRRHPDIDINIRASPLLIDFTNEDVDLAVRYGGGQWPGVHAVPLADEEVFPVCSPRFNDGRLPKTLGQLARSRLLHTPLQPWDEWFGALGVESPAPRRGMTFAETDILLRAAIGGLGIALSRRLLAQPELDAGRLVRPVPQTVRAERSYYIVYSAHIEPSQHLAIFRDWLLEQARPLSMKESQHGTRQTA